MVLAAPESRAGGKMMPFPIFDAFSRFGFRRFLRFFAFRLAPILLLPGLSMSNENAPHARPSIPSPAGLRELPPDGGEKWNRLVFEQSPYLLQHAANPVDWWPWGEAAFEAARAQDKPVFLSVGYSTCHWCHVMERESFEDEEVAALLNEHMIAIKVDREERPDIDHVYMTVTQAMTGSGGWPMTAVMTPDKKPFFAGTYYPKESQWGRPGMTDLVPALGRAWKEDREKVLRSANQIAEAIADLGNSRAGAMPNGEVLEHALDDYKRSYDRAHGGFGGGRNKFPVPHNLSLLLRIHARTGNDEARAMVEHTLQQMRLGGIWDHVGHGFHRYSTDEIWLLPHFEKMLYDQALHAIAYSEAYQLTGNEEYARVVRAIFDYVLRDMTAPGGGFYSAEDADSEGVEGKFYVWTREEVAEVLGAEDAELFQTLFNIEKEGNFSEEATGRRTGESIPHLKKPLGELAASMKMTPEALAEKAEALRGKLFEHREARVHPYKDDKILTDWNGLMIAALARGGMALGEEKYVHAAEKAANFILTDLRGKDGRLLKRARNGEAGLPAHLEDYAFIVWGLLDLYEATFDVRYLQEAVTLTDVMIEHYADETGGGFFQTADDGEVLLTRAKDAYDGAIPSGNGVAVCNLARLAHLTGEEKYDRLARGTAAAFGTALAEQPTGHSQMLIGIDLLLGPATEVVLAGNADDPVLREMAGHVRRAFLPRTVLVHRPEGDEAPILGLAKFTRAQTPVKGRAVGYICRNFACELPARTVDEFRERLKNAITVNAD
ncbi:MAG: uncharacterized protein PWP23_1753 [Candidatus Sumerlaeota bacterium]|nr:uncharacterized protein [Candidatus Sumerlaeota bacterium]